MIGKIFITSVVAALLAGGAVYFGMAEEDAVADDAGGTIKIAQADTSSSDEPQSTKKWIDRYLRKETQDDVQVPDSLPDNAPEIEPDDVAEADMQAEPEVTEETSRDAAVVDSRPLPDVPVPPKPVQTRQVPPNDPMPRPRGAVMERYRMASVQANYIEQDGLRDQAYMGIVDFAVSEGLTAQALKTIDQIKQAELRDTARSRVAIAMAKNGQAEAAFELIEDVEVEDLRDIMRLQVIEAMILPERLPQGM